MRFPFLGHKGLLYLYVCPVEHLIPFLGSWVQHVAKRHIALRALRHEASLDHETKHRRHEGGANRRNSKDKDQVSELLALKQNQKTR